MYKQLTDTQRYEIHLGLKRKWSKSRIAGEIGVSVSTVCRKVRRNADPSGEYVWSRAQSRYLRRRHGLPGNCSKDKDVPNGKYYKFEPRTIRISQYRPFCKEFCYFDRSLNNCVYQMPQLFPTNTSKNIVISTLGAGGNKDFNPLISDCLLDYQTQFNGFCFPLYWYEENKNPQASLFDDADTNRYIRRDGITD